MELRDCGLLQGKPPVVSVDPHVPALLAFMQMLDAGVTGAAVVNAEGEMVANLSVSDLRCGRGDCASKVLAAQASQQGWPPAKAPGIQPVVKCIARNAAIRSSKPASW